MEPKSVELRENDWHFILLILDAALSQHPNPDLKEIANEITKQSGVKI